MIQGYPKQEMELRYCSTTSFRDWVRTVPSQVFSFLAFLASPICKLFKLSRDLLETESQRLCDGKLLADHVFERWCNSISNPHSSLPHECRMCSQLEGGLRQPIYHAPKLQPREPGRYLNILYHSLICCSHSRALRKSSFPQKPTRLRIKCSQKKPLSHLTPESKKYVNDIEHTSKNFTARSTSQTTDRVSRTSWIAEENHILVSRECQISD